MQRTAMDLMEYFQARAAYTFSDEITLVLPPIGSTVPLYNGKVTKITTTAAGTNPAMPLLIRDA